MVKIKESSTPDNLGAFCSSHEPDGYAVACAAAFVFAFALIIAPFPAFASSTPMSEVLCIVLGIIQKDIGKGLATIGMCVLGVGALLGKASWGMALTVGVGIAVLFGAVSIVTDLGLGTADCS